MSQSANDAGSTGLRSRAMGFVRRTWVVYLLILPLPVYYLTEAATMDPRSAILPRIVSWTMVGLAALIAITDWRSTPEGEQFSTVAVRNLWRKWWKTTGMLALTVLLVAGLGQIGFYPASAVFLFASFTLLEAGGLIRRLVYTAGSLAGCFLLFEMVLGVRLP